MQALPVNIEKSVVIAADFFMVICAILLLGDICGSGV